MNFKSTVGCLALALVFSIGCTSKPAKPRLGEVERLPRLETTLPKFLPREVKVDLLATVEPMEIAQLCAQVPGEVKGLTKDIDVGRMVQNGDPLVTLDIPSTMAERDNKLALLVQAKSQRDLAEQAKKVAAEEVQEARAQVLRFKAELDFRDLQLRRVRDLARREVVQPQLREESELQRNAAKAALDASQASIATREAKLKSAELDIKVSESRIKVAEADLKVVHSRVEFATIRAPFNGVITNRMVHNGAVIKDPGTPLFTVVRTDQVRVIVNVPERYVPMIRARMGHSPKGEANRALMKFQSYEVDGRITRLASAVDRVSRLMRAEIHILTSAALDIRPGMTGTATIILDEGKTKKMTIPSTALVRVGDEIRVYYIENPTGTPPRGKVQMVKVELGLDDGRTVEIRNGLTGKEIVITKGNGVVREGEIAIPVGARERKHD